MATNAQDLHLTIRLSILCRPDDRRLRHLWDRAILDSGRSDDGISDDSRHYLAAKGNAIYSEEHKK